MEQTPIQYASSGHVRVRSRTEPNAALWWVGQITWFILAVAILGGASGVIGVEYSELMGWISPIWTLLAVVSLAVLLRGLRRSWDATTIEYLEQAVRLNLPLPGMLRAAEADERRFVRKRIRRLRRQIEEGATIGDSLSRALPGFLPRVRSLIVSGERCGRLAPTLRRIVEQDRRLVRRNPLQRIYLRWYPIILLLTLAAVTAAIGAFVIPKFIRISHDFNASMSWMRLWNAIFNAAVVVIPLAGILAIFACSQLLLTLFHPRYGMPGPLRRCTDWLLWNLPAVRVAARAQALGDVCNLLGGATESGLNLHAVLIEAAEVRTNAVLQRRLRRWATGIESGLGTQEAAQAARMPAIMIGLIGPANTTPDLSNVFRFLARYYDAQFSRAALLLEGAVIPGISIVFGAATLFVSLSVYLPMIEIMKHLMPKGMSW